MRASNTAWRPLPSAFARYMATSASRITSAGAASCSASAMPIEAATTSSRPSRWNGSCSVCWTRSAITVASRASQTSSSRIVNSSPPRRATVSPGRRADSSRRATAISSRSPTWWPSESLTSLKRSRSRNSTAAQVAGWRRWPRRIAWSRRSRNSTRLGSPVRSSCSASCWRRCSAWRRSVTSVWEPTTRVARPVVVAHRDAAGEHPAVAAVAVLDPVLGLEVLGGAVEVALERLGEPGAVVGVHAAQPLARRVADVGLRVAEHRLPARGEVQPVGAHVPVPQAVVGALQRERVALLGLGQARERALVGDRVAQAALQRRPRVGRTR